MGYLPLRTVAFALFCCTPGCTTTEYLQAESAGHVGCAAEEITIFDDRARVYHRTWSAICEDRVYTCSLNQAGHSSCVEKEQGPQEKKDGGLPVYSGAWERASFGVCPGSALFPGAPRQETESTPLGLSAEVDMEVLQARTDAAVFVAALARPAPDQGDWQAALDSSIAAMIERTQGRLLALSPLEKRSGYSLLLALPAGQGQLLAWIFHAGPCLYTLAVTPRGRVAAADLRRFFSSIEVGDAARPSAPSAR